MARSSLIALSDAVRAYFVATNVAANVPACGWKERGKQINQGPGGASRVIFMPGKYTGEPGPPKVLEGGRIGRAQRKTNLNPRELVSWDRVSTVSVWGVDAMRSDDEEAQIEATETLFECTVRAMHNSVDLVTGVPLGAGAIEWGDVFLVAPPTERGFGREMLVTFVHKAVFFDDEIDTAFPSAAVARNPAA